MSLEPTREEFERETLHDVAVVTRFLIAIALLIGFIFGFLYGQHEGYQNGRDYVCQSPQVPFKTVQLPACATDDAKK